MNEDKRNNEQKEYDRQLRMLVELNRLEAFQVWRDQVVSPVIDQLELELASNEADSLPEPILRGKLKQLNSLKHIFKNVFEIAGQNLKNNK